MLAISIAIALGAHSSSMAASHSLSGREAICGVNALYMFLRLSSIDVTYPQVAAALGPTDEGHSFLELQHAAAEFGIATDVVHLDSQESFRAMTLPMILLRSNAPGQPGHYLVIWKRGDSDLFHLIDGTTGHHLVNTIALLKAQGKWTGYALVRRRGGKEPRPYLVLAGIAILGMSLIACSRTGVASRLYQLRNKMTMALLSALVTLLSSSLQADERPSTQGDCRAAWRVPSHDGVNVWYLFSVLHRHPADYESVRRQLASTEGSTSFADIVRMAREQGLCVEVVSPSPKSLDSVTPGIVILRSNRIHGGGFCLLTSVESDEVHLVSGGDVRWFTVSKDTFLEDWTGHVLYLPSRHRFIGLEWCSLATVVGAGAVYWRHRRRTCMPSLPCEGAAKGHASL